MFSYDMTTPNFTMCQQQTTLRKIILVSQSLASLCRSHWHLIEDNLYNHLYNFCTYSVTSQFVDITGVGVKLVSSVKLQKININHGTSILDKTVSFQQDLCRRHYPQPIKQGGGLEMAFSVRPSVRVHVLELAGQIVMNFGMHLFIKK